MKVARLLLLFFVVSILAHAQSMSDQRPHQLTRTITVLLLNAKTGKPMNNKMVTVRWADGWDKSEVTLDREGAGMVEVPAGVHEFMLEPGPKVGKEPYRVAYLDCNEPRSANIQVSLVLEKGFVPRNVCSDKATVAHPGDVVFWGLPKPWWQPDFQ